MRRKSICEIIVSMIIVIGVAFFYFQNEDKIKQMNITVNKSQEDIQEREGIVNSKLENLNDLEKEVRYLLEENKRLKRELQSKEDKFIQSEKHYGETIEKLKNEKRMLDINYEAKTENYFKLLKELGSVSEIALMGDTECIKKESDIMILKTLDCNTIEPLISSILLVNKSDTIEEKLMKLAEKASIVLFYGLKVEFEEIKKIDEKKIAVINLDEITEERGITTRWDSRLFQGSTGGAITTYKLTEAFLQRDYTGEWIDGVKFLYKGEDILYQHAPDLEFILYR